MLQTPLHAWHVAHHGRMVDFAGWSMPVQYTSIVDEHTAVRQKAGLFDISHMGRLEFTGPDAVRFLDHLLTNSVASLAPGQVRYSLVCKDDGGILDDVLVYRVEQGMQQRPTHLLVVNASNREKILAWIAAQKSGFNVDVVDRTTEWAMIALQGPLAGKLFEDYSGSTLSGKKYYTAWGDQPPRGFAIISRTGYTGEDGIELMLPADAAAAVWNDLYDRGQSIGLVACGLGCRDTLRLEAAMPLYGHELSETIDPLTAGLQFAVKLDKPEFIGLAALNDIATKIKYQRVGLILDGRRIAREHCAIQSAGKNVGEVTSGTFSPTLQKSLAMGYVEIPFAAAGTKLEIDVRGKAEAATVVDLPFYRRPKTAAH